MTIPCVGRLRACLPLTLLAAVASFGFSGTSAYGQESKALIDALIRKGVLTTKEGEEIRSELSKEAATETSAGKIKLSNSVSELKLYGDVRLRYQYDNKDPQDDPAGVGINGPLNERNPNGNQRSRWRFRLRLNADFKLADHFFGGVELQTGSASDSANQTFENGFQDYGIYINKAYIGYSPTDWLTLTAGKVPNPLYTTDLVWDPDIAPTGITEQIQLHKLWAHHEEAGYSKDGKGSVSLASSEPKFELTLIAGQFIFDDNAEGGGSDLSGAVRDNDRTTDAFVFHTQLVAGYHFTKEVKLTVAPGWLIYNAGSAADLDNNNKFEDSGLVSGATRNLNILLLPGDVSFKLGSIKTKVYWDFAYNLEGRKRVEDIYRLTSLAPTGEGGVPDPDDRIKNHSSRDDYAFLVGFQLGENKKRGDWSLLANYRRTGIGAVDPNINDSDFAEGELNTQGFKIGVAYNLADFAVFGVTYQHAWQLRDLHGGEATGGNGIADSNDIQTLQVDLNVKF